MDNVLLRAIYATLGGAAAFFAVIFIPAWTLDTGRAGAFFLTLTVPTTLVTIFMALYDKALLERRLRMGPSVEKRVVQKIIACIGLPVFVGAFVVMVFDHRFGWSPVMPCVSFDTR